MKKLLWTVSALALAGLCFTGCDEEIFNGLNPEYNAVDNEKYCDGTCGKDGNVNAPNCFTMDINSTDKDDTFCSACTYNCALKYATTNPNCVQENDVFGSAWGCGAAAACPAGQGFKVDSVTGKATCEALDLKTCQSNTDCSGDQVCNMETKQCEDKTEETEDHFTYVRIDDMMGKCEGGTLSSKGICSLDDPGADIDAVVLVKANGTVAYATDVIAYKRSDFTKEFKTLADVKAATEGEIKDYGASDPTAIKGKPDSFVTYGNNFDGNCQYYKTLDADGKGKKGDPRTYVSLGGEGGYIEVEMGGNIEAGDKIDVLEVGKCKLFGTSDGTKPEAKADKVKVSISVSSDEGTWKVLGEGEPDDKNKGILSFNVTENNLK